VHAEEDQFALSNEEMHKFAAHQVSQFTCFTCFTTTGPQFTCCTSTSVQIGTPPDNLRRCAAGLPQVEAADGRRSEASCSTPPATRATPATQPAAAHRTARGACAWRGRRGIRQRMHRYGLAPYVAGWPSGHRERRAAAAAAASGGGTGVQRADALRAVAAAAAAAAAAWVRRASARVCCRACASGPNDAWWGT
jgi:hypothetical protein